MEPHVAGHSTHFLRRLDRVRQDQVETALALYNDPELVKETLSRAQVPEGAARIAIALDRSDAPPHVVVTRDGKFVTCLGAGMATTDLFVVSRERLDVAAAHVERMRERLGQVRALEDGGGDVTRQVQRLGDSGPAFCREDFEALARWEPLLGLDFVTAQLRIEQDYLPQFAALRRHLKGRMPPSLQPLLTSFWRGVWAASHLSVLSHVGDVHGRIARFGWSPEEEMDQRRVTALLGSRHALVGPSLRSFWCVGRHGRAGLGAMKRAPDRSFVGYKTPASGLEGGLRPLGSGGRPRRRSASAHPPASAFAPTGPLGTRPGTRTERHRVASTRWYGCLWRLQVRWSP